MAKRITQTENGFTFGTKHFSVTLNKSAVVENITNLANGKEINDSEKNPEFIFLNDYNKSKIPPVLLEKDGEEFKATFENGMTVNFVIECFDDFLTVELTSELKADGVIEYVTFANLTTSLSEPDSEYVINSMGMSFWTKTADSGIRLVARDTIAWAYPELPEGIKGAKVGIVLSRRDGAVKAIQALADAIDPKIGLISKAGGPYAREWRGNFEDYAIILDMTPETIDESIKLCKEFCIGQYDVHQKAGVTFTQGDFRFANTEHGEPSEFREGLGKKLRDAGLTTALHTYAYYIDKNAHSILTDPKWQSDLMVVRELTLAEDISADAVEIPTLEDASDFNTHYAYSIPNMPYVLVDNEIIRVNKATAPALAECIRGTCGTTAVSHRKGTVVKQLTGKFLQFTPVFGSELFYHVADLTAKAYNEGGFDMLYFDAIDGLGSHMKNTRDVWYYFHSFIHRVVSQCERTPIVETSSGGPSEWNVRGRYGAWDYPHAGIKKFVSNHVKSNIVRQQKNVTTTLGWFNFFPDLYSWGRMKNNNYKTEFHDDLDYFGMNALLYDMTVVYHPLPVKDITENPFYYSNIKYYTEHYTKLRRSHYFKPEVLEKVKSVGGEWRVVKRDDEFVFQQIHYNKTNLGNLKDGSDLTCTGKNPFKKQMPFIRIEARYSTLFDEPKTLLNHSGKIEGTLEKSPINFENIDERMAMTMKIKGTGRDGDAALISLSGGIRGESAGRSDHLIDLNFEGWRDLILFDIDNGEYDTDKYKFEGVVTDTSVYTTFRCIPNHFQLDTAAIRLCGETAGNAEFGDLITYPHTEAPIKNPSVTVGNDTVTFNCELHGGDYIEYDPETDKALLFHNTEQTVEEITMTGGLAVDGEYTATYSAECLTDAPLRAKLVFGFTGDEAKNN
ncbi:MAG: hypothetical protein IKV53_06625 [Clostridia bacterium]|nr:hypothetical protein [Clostridia bacterium]